MTGVGGLPSNLPHWVLELLAIGVGVGLVLLQSNYGLDLGGAALAGAGVGGLIHDVSS